VLQRDVLVLLPVLTVLRNLSVLQSLLHQLYVPEHLFLLLLVKLQYILLNHQLVVQVSMPFILLLVRTVAEDEVLLDVIGAHQVRHHLAVSLVYDGL